MRIIGLDFIEAIKALKERKCEAIQHGNFSNELYSLNEDCILTKFGSPVFLKAKMITSNNWKLIEPVEEPEDCIEIVKYFSPSNNMYFDAFGVVPSDCIKLTGKTTPMELIINNRGKKALK